MGRAHQGLDSPWEHHSATSRLIPICFFPYCAGALRPDEGVRKRQARCPFVRSARLRARVLDATAVFQSGPSRARQMQATAPPIIVAIMRAEGCVCPPTEPTSASMTERVSLTSIPPREHSSTPRPRRLLRRGLRRCSFAEKNVCRCDRFHVSRSSDCQDHAEFLPQDHASSFAALHESGSGPQDDIRALSKILPMHPGVCRNSIVASHDSEEALANASRPDADCTRDRCHIRSFWCDWVTVEPSKRG